MLTVKEINELCKENDVKLMSTYRGKGHICNISCNKCGHNWKSTLEPSSMVCSNCITEEVQETQEIQEDDYTYKDEIGKISGDYVVKTFEEDGEY